MLISKSNMSKVESKTNPINLENNTNNLNLNTDKNTENECSEFNPLFYKANIQQELFIQRQVRFLLI